MGNCLCLRHASSPRLVDSGDFPPALLTNTKEKADIFRSYPSLVRFLLHVEPASGATSQVLSPDSGAPTSNASSTSISTQEQKVAETTSSVASLPVTIKDVEDFRQMPGYGNVQTFTYEELRLATKNFRPDLILGEGGFGLVYKGAIDGNIRPGFEYIQVAVKELNPEGLQGDKEWLAEVNYLGQFSHRNLVKLIGYCCEAEHRLLVYEYMARGSLENHLFRRGGTTLPWLTRIKIALDVANGLAFLHGAERPIIYRDFKTSNILLDMHYNGKLSDFGLAKEGPMGEQTHVSTRVMGTYGYAAPEYILTGHLTARSDVYGFGVVLLEMLTGRKSLDECRPTREYNLVEWARPLLIRSHKLFRIIDPRMDGQYLEDNVEVVARLAYECLSQNPKARPVMSEVVDVLASVRKNEESIPLPSPDSVVTLYEAPRMEDVHSSAVARKREASAERGGGRRRIRPSRERRSGSGSPLPQDSNGSTEELK